MNRLFEGLSPLSVVGMWVILFGIVAVVVSLLVMLTRDLRDQRTGYATSSGWDGHTMPSYARDIQLPHTPRGRTIDSEIVVLPDDADLNDSDIDDEDERFSDDLRAFRAQLDAPYQDVAPLAPPMHPQVDAVSTRTTVMEHSSYTRTMTYFAPEPVPYVHPLAVDPRDDILPWWYRLMSDSPTLDMKDMIVAPMPAPRTSHRRESTFVSHDSPSALEFPTGQFSVVDLLAAVGSSAA